MKFLFFKTKHNFYKKVFPSTTIEWNNLDQDLRNSESYTLFGSSILNFIRASPNSFYSCQNVMVIKLFTRRYLVLSHLREHKIFETLSVITGWTLNPPRDSTPVSPVYQWKMHPHKQLEQN